MDVSTIPDNVWTACSVRAEAVLEKLWSNSPENFTKALQNVGTVNVLRKSVCQEFYTLYSSANRDLVYMNSDLVAGGADPGWRDFLEIANNNRATPPTTARWIPDQDRNACKQCGKAFGTFTRKHHCRLCGDIFCDTHSRQRMQVTNPLTPTGRETGGLQRNERVCDSCHRMFTQAVKSPLGKMEIQENNPGVEIEQNTKQVRPWQYITPGGHTKARVQFVVNTGGGVVLFSRLNRSFQEYFHTHPLRNKSFYGYKVFSEEFGQGRGDSAVVYLCEASDHPDVTDWWESAVQKNADFRSSLDNSAVAYGLRSMNHGGWAIDLPPRAREVAVLGDCSGGSAGALIGNVVGMSFFRAAYASQVQRTDRGKSSVLADPQLGNTARERLLQYRSAMVRNAKLQFVSLQQKLYR